MSDGDLHSIAVVTRYTGRGMTATICDRQGKTHTLRRPYDHSLSLTSNHRAVFDRMAEESAQRGWGTLRSILHSGTPVPAHLGKSALVWSYPLRAKNANEVLRGLGTPAQFPAGIRTEKEYVTENVSAAAWLLTTAAAGKLAYEP